MCKLLWKNSAQDKTNVNYFDAKPLLYLPRIPVYVPTGFACFPNELMHTPRLWVRQKYRKLINFTPMACGGHFAAMEEPQLMAEDIQKFTKMVESKNNWKWTDELKATFLCISWGIEVIRLLMFPLLVTNQFNFCKRSAAL